MVSKAMDTEPPVHSWYGEREKDIIKKVHSSISLHAYENAMLSGGLLPGVFTRLV